MDGQSKENPNPGESKLTESFMKFMTNHWMEKGLVSKRSKKIKNVEFFSKRRNALSNLFPGDTLIVACGHERQRSNDTMYRFRPSSDFYYLTGCQEEGSILVLKPKSQGHESILFVRGEGQSDGSFFTDKMHGELWVGRRPGLDECKKAFGVDNVFRVAEFSEKVQSFSGRVRTLGPVMVKDEHSGKDDVSLVQTISDLRLIKDASEIKEIVAAIKSTKRAFEDAIRALNESLDERDVEVAFDSRARREGNGVGYNTIAASGPNACTLHWIRNDGKAKFGQLFLLDAGVERKSLYTADITRTFPVSGMFSEAQAIIYDLVNQARKAALKELRPGIDFLDPQKKATEVIVRGLCSLGILNVSPEEAIKGSIYKRYTLHGISHMLGLDVHDCSSARPDYYRYGKLVSGMVFTVEPGLYFQPNDLTVPKKFRGIGIRIEDNVVITKAGYSNLSDDIPTERRDIETWMKEISVNRMSKSDKKKVKK